MSYLEPWKSEMLGPQTNSTAVCKKDASVHLHGGSDSWDLYFWKWLQWAMGKDEGWHPLLVPHHLLGPLRAFQQSDGDSRVGKLVSFCIWGNANFKMSIFSKLVYRFNATQIISPKNCIPTLKNLISSAFIYWCHSFNHIIIALWQP